MSEKDENSSITKLLLMTAEVLEITEELRSKLRIADVMFMLDMLESTVRLLKQRHPSRYKYCLPHLSRRHKERRSQ